MKILQLGKFYPIRGGVEKVMWDLTRGLSEQGVDCDMLCACLPSDRTDPKDAAFEAPDGTLHLNDHGRVYRVKAISKKAATMLSPAMIAWLRRRGAEYDIIHIHHPDPMAALALRLSGFRGKVVLHWHSDIVSQKFLLAMYRPLQTWLVKRAQLIIGTTPAYIQSSPWLREVQSKCTYVPIGIRPLPADITGAAAIREQFPGKTILLSIGRLVPYKGYPVLIQAMKHLPEKYHLIIGGEGPLRGELEKLIDSENLRDRISLMGYLADEALPAYYGACDIFILSSVMKTEAFGIVQIEAMSCGKPVVATKIPGSGVSWVNEDGVSGLTVPPGDAKALADAIRTAAEHPEKYGEKARRRYAELFTKEKMLEGILAVYRRFLAI